VRALVEDPTMDVDRVRRLAAERMAVELGLPASALTD